MCRIHKWLDVVETGACVLEASQGELEDVAPPSPISEISLAEGWWRHRIDDYQA